MKKKLIFTLVLIVYLAVIILFAYLPNGMGSLPKGMDKVLHFAEFFVLTIIFLKTLSFYDVKNRLLITFTTGLIVAIISELIQIPILSREFSLLDFGADLLGIITALMIKWKSSKQ